MVKKVLLLVIVVFVLFIPVVAVVQLVEWTFWHPNEDQLVRMKADFNLCFHNADCRTESVQFITCGYSEVNKYSPSAGFVREIGCEPLQSLYVPVCVENECTKKILGIF